MHVPNLEQLMKYFLDGAYVPPQVPLPHTSISDLFTRLLYDFSWRHKDLVWSFNYIDGNRALTGCAYYFSECNSLSTIFRDLTHNCTTLRKTCLNGYKPKKPTLMKSI
ncbi:hypothetical protein PMAC_000003 [Pneumocystis sp. 'macacae']|nr:hypothetical protein PMAC_000003 [Pneumocystis sp. 'macacae']